MPVATRRERRAVRDEVKVLLDLVAAATRELAQVLVDMALPAETDGPAEIALACVMVLSHKKYWWVMCELMEVP